MECGTDNREDDVAGRVKASSSTACPLPTRALDPSRREHRARQAQPLHFKSGTGCRRASCDRNCLCLLHGWRSVKRGACRGLTLEVTGPFAADLGNADDNLVLRAARALAERAGVRGGAAIRLENVSRWLRDRRGSGGCGGGAPAVDVIVGN